MAKDKIKDVKKKTQITIKDLAGKVPAIPERIDREDQKEFWKEKGMKGIKESDVKKMVERIKELEGMLNQSLEEKEQSIVHAKELKQNLEMAQDRLIKAEAKIKILTPKT